MILKRGLGMNRFLTIVLCFIVSLIIPFSASYAKELPKALGITFGAPYFYVYYAYNGGIPTSNEILSGRLEATRRPSKSKYFSVSYKRPLVNLRGAGQTTYKVFDGKVYSCLIRFPTNSIISRYQELYESLYTKYGKPSYAGHKPAGGVDLSSPLGTYWGVPMSREYLNLNATWSMDKLSIDLKRDTSTIFDEKRGEPLILEYTFTPIEKALEKYKKQSEIDAL